MSHVVTITTQIRDPVALSAACRRLQLPAPIGGRHKLFADEVDGLAVTLRDWRFPVVCRPAAGELRYDNFQGRWGEQVRLDELLQAYAIEKATLEARRQGRTVVERALADGAVQLTITIGGAP